MAVPVRLRPTFSPAALFETPVQPGYLADSHRWQLAPDGRRFLLLAPESQQPSASFSSASAPPSLVDDCERMGHYRHRS